jgi:Copper binding periplasmic protein CusF
MTSFRRALVATALVAVFGPTPSAHAAREFARGNITAVDWRVMQIEIRTPQGGRQTYKVARNCAVRFTDAARDFPNPRLEDLTPPMYIHFSFENQTVFDIDVKEVGRAARPSPPHEPDRPSADRQIKVRILRLDERRGTFDADVAGRRQTFRAEPSRLLRGFGEGDLVILTLDRRGDLVTDIRGAGQSGRVTQVDERRGEVSIEVRGRETLYQVDEPRLLRRIRVGDRVAFEVEERRGRRVITSIE